MGPPEGGYIMSSVPKRVIWQIEEEAMSLSVLYNNIVFVLFCQSSSFNPSLSFVYVSVSRPLRLSESYSASQTLQYSPSCSSDDLHQGIAFVGRCDPKS